MSHKEAFTKWLKDAKQLTTEQFLKLSGKEQLKIAKAYQKSLTR